ncbi:MAG: DUF4097 family beta strand repeat-containing protein [Chloroflexia bacterium]
MNSAANKNGLLFEVSGDQPAGLGIEHISGDITITGWDRQAIEISSTDADYEDDLSQILACNQRGNTVTIGLNIPPRGFGGSHGDIDNLMRNVDNLGKMMRRLGRSVSLDLRISVPHRCDVNIRTATGDLNVGDIQGKVFVQSASGDIALHDIAGNVLLKTASADVVINGLRGRLGARTISGDLVVADCELAALSVGTVSGDIRLTGALHTGGQYDLNTVSGDIRLALPTKTRAGVEFQTVSGDLDCSLPHTTQRENRRHRRIEINGGGDIMLRLHTTSGDVSIGGGPGSVPTGPAPAGEDEEIVPAETHRFTPGEAETADMARADLSGSSGANDPDATQRLDTRPERPRKSPEMTILEAIESGEMSVDDGLRRLQEMGQ